MNDDFTSSGVSHQTYDSFKIISVSKKIVTDNSRALTATFGYRAIIVTYGEGTININDEILKLHLSDVVIIPPYRKVSDFCERDLGYLSILFEGEEARMYANQFGFQDKPKHFCKLYDSANGATALTDFTGEALLLRAKSLIYLIFSELSIKNSIGHTKSLSESAAKKTKEYIDEFFTDPELSLKSIGEALSYHPNYISKVFNSAYGISVAKYVNVQRVRHARFLIDQGDGSLKVISAECGFTDSDYFSSVFKSLYGQSPRDYIKRIRSIDTIPD